MPYIRSLLDGAPNTISGHLYVSVLGGNTANSEFEYLTGDSMAFLPSGSIPYQQYLNKYAPVNCFTHEGIRLQHNCYASVQCLWLESKLCLWKDGLWTVSFLEKFPSRWTASKICQRSGRLWRGSRCLKSKHRSCFIFNVTMTKYTAVMAHRMITSLRLLKLSLKIQIAPSI